MALQKRPLYVFENATETGLDEVPLNRLVLVESLKSLYYYDDNIGVSSTTTIQQAIDANKLKVFWSKDNDGPYSGIEATNSKLWGKYRLTIDTKNPDSSVGEVNDIMFIKK
jgi:hypothetical protein